MSPSNHRLQSVALAITRWVGSLQSIIIHTLLFILSFGSVVFGLISFDRMLLVLTTIVSLEAIYLSIFIQMTINVQAASLQEVEEDIDEMQEDVEEIQEDIDEIQEDVDEIQEDVDEIQEDVVELQPQLAGMPKMAAPEGAEDALQQIRTDLQRLIRDVEKLQAKE